MRELLGALQVSARERLGVVPALAEIHEHLEHHFAGEEQSGGLFDMIRSAGPWHSDRADALEKEHASLLNSVQFIATRIDEIDPDEAWSEIEHFIALMRAHEISEGVLYQDAMQELRSLRTNDTQAENQRGTKNADSMSERDTVDVLRQPKLLLVEEDDNNGKVFSRMLSEDGFQVEVVYDEGRAIDRLKLDPLPDAIITNALSGQTDGLAVAHFARTRAPRIPVVIVTAYPHLVDSGSKRFDPPAIVHKKPIDYRAFSNQMNALLGGNHAHRRAAADD